MVSHPPSQPRSGKTIAILQSNYIPWKGYFDLIAAVDEFVFFDQVQYTTDDWRNRNRIKTAAGTAWLTIPIGRSTTLPMHQVRPIDSRWTLKHWKSMQAHYARAPAFDEIAAWLEPLYLTSGDHTLSDINRRFIRAVCAYLKLPTRLRDVSEFEHHPGKTDRLVSICRQAGASRYVSGPAARSYIDAARFAAADIELTWYDYSGYREYPQLWGPFIHEVSVIDLLMNCGTRALDYMHAGRAS